jgi:hypothetical protein
MFILGPPLTELLLSLFHGSLQPRPEIGKPIVFLIRRLTRLGRDITWLIPRLLRNIRRRKRRNTGTRLGRSLLGARRIGRIRCAAARLGQNGGRKRWRGGGGRRRLLLCRSCSRESLRRGLAVGAVGRKSGGGGRRLLCRCRSGMSLRRGLTVGAVGGIRRLRRRLSSLLSALLRCRLGCLLRPRLR